MEKESFKYYAFISYSHKDKTIAKKLQKRLKSYHLPSKLQRSFPDLPKNLNPIFMDESNLVAVGTLREALQKNLKNSNYLIVICSPNSAKSEYVNDEVDYFINNGRVKHIIPLIIDGKPYSEDPSTECFPPALRALPKELELLGIDMKIHGRRKTFIRVIATMLELELDSFVSEVERERKKKRIIFTSIAATLVISAGMLAWYNIDTIQRYIANNYYDKKDYAKAMEWYQKAAIKGNVSAQNNFGKRKVQPLYNQRKLRTVPCENMAFLWICTSLFTYYFNDF